MQWQENVRTVEGKLLHEKAHDPAIKEKRGDTLIVRAMPIHSRRLGVSGECDVVEFHRTKDGIPLFGMDDRFVLTLINKKIMKESCFTKKKMAPYVQAMLLARYLRGDLDQYPPFFWK